jgi:hypothetical protein
VQLFKIIKNALCDKLNGTSFCGLRTITWGSAAPRAPMVEKQDFQAFAIKINGTI